MSYWNMSKRLYADRKAPDGIVSSGWRTVKKGGRVKIGGAYYSSDLLAAIVGEYVQVFIAEYWMTSVRVHRGVSGCSDYYCDARRCDNERS